MGRPQQAITQLARLALRPLERFLRVEAASGIVLIAAAAIALLWVNSPWRGSYSALWQTPHTFSIFGHSIAQSLEWVVNDLLMVVFFFVVGMEIRREIHHGELSTLRRAALPLVAALGGMVVPALIYLALAGNTAGGHGWGIPMATDIAFAIGILSLLGKRVPPALRVLLLALAVIDDLGAIIVIALFYSTGVSGWGFVIAAAGIAAIFLLQRLRISFVVAYALPSIAVWYGIYSAGVHPTIAGVIVGLITPVTGGKNSAIESPSQRLIDALHPWVAYGIMPLFALANAGVSLGGIDLNGAGTQVLLGVIAGLVIGKPLGVLGACWLGIKLKITFLPRGLAVRHLIVLGAVAGVGFTMSLFVAQLAFTSPTLLANAKLAVLIASTAAGMLALIIGRLLLLVTIDPSAAATLSEAESSTEK
jgi:Na+:H+ antiporter, NhaA family